MKNIDSICKLLASFFKIMCYALPISTILMCFNLETAFKLGFFQGIISIESIKNIQYFSFIDRGVILLIQCIPSLITVLISYQLNCLFQLYSQGKYFELESINAIKKTGIFMLIGELINPFYQAFMSYYLTRYNSSGHHLISVTLDSNTIETVLTALIIFICAHVVAIARKFQIDSALTI